MEQRCFLGVCVSEGAHSPSLGIKKDGSLWTLYLAFTLSRTHRYPRETETGKGQQVSVESSGGRILTGKKLRFYLTSSHGTESVLPNSGKGSQNQVGGQQVCD